jgi:nucleoside-diphosphate-sugar epimerase
MYILLLGASGFVGSVVLKKLLEIGNVSITCATRNIVDKNYSNARLHWVELDLLDTEFPLSKLVLNVDVVINCVGELNSLEMMREVNFEVVKRIVDILLKMPKKTHFIQLSSVGCYGAITRYRGKQAVITEVSEEQPVGEYEQTKTLADDYIREKITNNTENVDFTIVRPSNVFGENMKSDALRNLAKTVKQGKFFYIRDRKSIATYVHVFDVANLILLCVNNKKDSKNEIFIASDDSLQVNLIHTFVAYFKVKKPSLVVPEFIIRVLGSIIIKVLPQFPLTQARIDSLASRVSFSNDKAKSKLGFCPEFPLEKNLNGLLDLWRIKDSRKD